MGFSFSSDVAVYIFYFILWNSWKYAVSEIDVFPLVCAAESGGVMYDAFYPVCFSHDG